MNAPTHIAERVKIPGSGWMLLLASVFPTLFTWIYFVTLAHQPSTWQQVAYTIGKGIQFSLPALWVYGVLRQPLRMGWPSFRHAGLGWGFLSGTIVALATVALYILLLRDAPWFAEVRQQILDKVDGFGIKSVTSYAALSVFYSAIHSGLEEYYWRWFVFDQLRQRLSWMLAATLSSLAFMAHHVILLAAYFGWDEPLAYLFSIGVAVGGWFWAWLYLRTGRLTGSWLSHLLVDAGIFGVGYLIIQSSI